MARENDHERDHAARWRTLGRLNDDGHHDSSPHCFPAGLPSITNGESRSTTCHGPPESGGPGAEDHHVVRLRRVRSISYGAGAWVGNAPEAAY